MEEQIWRASQVIKEADVLLITAGAGMGVDSGLPDFRGNEGFWKAYPALKGLSFVDMANPAWFYSDPYRAWGFYGHRLNLYRQTIPHQGFKLLLKWAQNKSESSFIFTSNVDGHFQKAGFSEDQICECHGSIHHIQGFTPSGPIRSADTIELVIDHQLVKLIGPLPYHQDIGGAIRPNILMFGDGTWNDQRTEVQHDRLERWLSLHQNSRIAVIEMGAGTAIPSVRYQGERVVRRHRFAQLIRINPRESQTSNLGDRGISIALGALEALEHIYRKYD